MKRSAVFLTILGLLAVTALWWVFLVSPRFAETADTDESIEAEQARESTLRQQISNLQGIKDQEVSYLFAIGEMENAIPELPEVDAFLEELNFLASRTGVVLTQVSLATPIAPPEDTGGPLIIITTMNIEGQYFEVLGFLYGLEAMERLVRVETVTLRPIEVADEDAEEGPESGEEQENLAEGPRPRPDITTLEASFTAQLFTRTPVEVIALPGATTTTTTTAPTDGETETTTTTVPVEGATTTTTAPGDTTTTAPEDGE